MPESAAPFRSLPAAFAGVAAAAFFALVFIVVVKGEPLSAEMVSGLLQTINNLVLIAVSYLWGSSNASRIKDETIHAQATGGSGGALSGATVAGTADDPVHVDIEPTSKP